MMMGITSFSSLVQSLLPKNTILRTYLHHGNDHKPKESIYLLLTL